MIYVTAGAKTNKWRGVVLHHVPIRSRDGKLTKTWVAGFCTEFEGKDFVKEFVKNYGGSWDGVERFWYVPIPHTKLGEVLEMFWEVAQKGIEAFGEYMQMGGIHISVEAPLSADYQSKVVNWLEKKVKILNSGLKTVDNANVTELPTVRNIEKQEDENDNGVVQFVRFIGMARNNSEYLYQVEPENDNVFEIESGLDAEGKRWYWKVGEKLISEGFGSEGGWHHA